MIIRIIFSVIISLFLVGYLILGIFTAKEKDKVKKYLLATIVFGAFVCLFYVTSASSRHFIVMSTFASLHFISIDFTLLFLLEFTICFVRPQRIGQHTKIGIALKAWAFVEVVLFILNIFFDGLVLSYRQQNTEFAMYSYSMKPLYVIHLIYSYILILGVIGILVYRAFHVPKEYRHPFQIILACIGIIIILNAIFLFIPKDNPAFHPDYSVILYFIGTIGFYWAAYIYPRNGMLLNFKSYIVDCIDQGIVLFNYDNELLLCNEKARKYLPNIPIKNRMNLVDFQEACGLSINTVKENVSLQVYIKDNSQNKPLRCDYRKIKNGKDELIGRVFCFSDAQLDTDLLTGFHNWESFKMFAQEDDRIFPSKTTVAVCDINRLAVYNSVQGRSQGDALIKDLADRIKEIFPQDTYYVRGTDAHLIAICYNKTQEYVLDCLHTLSDSFKEKIQYATATTHSNGMILETIETAISGLKAKKLLDRDSTRSALIASLVRALQECDSDTEAHVERTRRMGTELGKKLGLSDVDLSKLSLLCLLHDIGKIGIPLEILNKPGRLTDEEWLSIKSHVTKGESIARTTPDLAPIADEIRLHHERWDGRGYPDGLSKEAIPLLARVISVVDAFDAMVNNRSYRKALSKDQAIEEIKRNSGTQFDPLIASKFLELIDEGYEIITNTEDDVVVKTQVVSAEEEKASKYKNLYPVSFSKYKLDSEFKIIKIDAEFTNLTGYTEEDIKANTLTQLDLIPEEDRSNYLILLNESLANSPVGFFEHRLLCKNKQVKFVYCIGRRYYDSVSREEKSEVIIANCSTTHAAKTLSINLERKSQKQLKTWEDTYRRDSLTGLLTHMAFVNDVEQKHMKNPNVPFMLIMIDIDNFKKFNDTYGHHNGDEFLISVSQTILSCLGEHDLACRMGGDEFMIASFLTQNQDYKEYANQIFNAIQLKLSTLPHSTTFSMGVAINSDSIKNFDEHYEAADKVLYYSKDEGKNCISFYDEWIEKQQKK